MTAGGQEENDVVDRGTMARGRGNDGRGWEKVWWTAWDGSRGRSSFTRLMKDERLEFSI